ncbi:hypothetical protein Sjap_005721 [Stephania japonica]|uniref:Uncharacterized protein n=1 Tax=Stephania japonica TaxID=461633 RepID=A0AAP0K659_9MAGN
MIILPFLIDKDEIKMRGLNFKGSVELKKGGERSGSDGDRVKVAGMDNSGD